CRSPRRGAGTVRRRATPLGARRPSSAPPRPPRCPSHLPDRVRDNSCPPCHPETSCSGSGGTGNPLLSQPRAPCTKHTAPCVSRLKFWGPEIAALKIGFRFSVTPQFLNLGIVTMPRSGPPNCTL